MAAEVLVMCSACGRPQRAGPTRCEACAAVLPDTPHPRPVATAVEAAWRYRSLAVRGERLEWRGGGRTLRLRLGAGGVREVRLVQRPLFEALLVAICAAVALALTPSGWTRLALVPVALGSLATCLLARRYRLAVKWEDGKTADLPLGTGPLRQGRTLRRGLAQLAGTLNPRRVTMPPA